MQKKLGIKVLSLNELVSGGYRSCLETEVDDYSSTFHTSLIIII